MAGHYFFHPSNPFAHPVSPPAAASFDVVSLSSDGKLMWFNARSKKSGLHGGNWANELATPSSLVVSKFCITTCCKCVKFRTNKQNLKWSNFIEWLEFIHFYLLLSFRAIFFITTIILNEAIRIQHKLLIVGFCTQFCQFISEILWFVWMKRKKEALNEPLTSTTI